MVLQPRTCVATRAVWALPRSLATTGGIISLFSLPGGTKMFQFPPFASAHCCTDNRPSAGWVVPFGNPRIKGYLHLPQAYRSLSRPSSPPRAKASTRRPNFLSPFMCAHAHIAHTISCNIEIITQFLKTKSSLLTVLCVNMSKISTP